jgi:hypothetical protein
VTDDALELLLTEHTTGLERLGDDTWRGVVPSQGRSFRLFVRRSGPYLRAELSPLVRVPDEPPRARAVLREALRRNRTLVEARFALDDDEELILEAVVEDDRPALEGALDALLAAAEAHLGPLTRL